MIKSRIFNLSILLLFIIPYPSSLSGVSNYLLQLSIVSLQLFFLIQWTGLNKTSILVSAFFTLYVFLHIILNLGLLDQGIIIFREFIKFFYISLSLGVLISRGPKLYFSSDHLQRIFDYILALITIVAIFQVIAPSYIDPIYSIVKTSWSLDQWRFRLTSTFENPNYLAFGLTVLNTFILLSRKSLFKKCIETLLIVSLVYVTGSRTGLIAILFLVFVHLMINSWKGLIIVSILSLLTIVYFGLEELLFQNRFENLFSYQNIGSIKAFNSRINVWDRGLDYFYVRPLFGYFISPIDITDSQYVMWLLKYGFPGITLIFTLLILLIRKLKVKFLYLLPVLIFLVTGSFYENFRIIGLVNILISYVCWYDKCDNSYVQ